MGDILKKFTLAGQLGMLGSSNKGSSDKVAMARAAWEKQAAQQQVKRTDNLAAATVAQEPMNPLLKKKVGSSVSTSLGVL